MKLHRHFHVREKFGMYNTLFCCFLMLPFLLSSTVSAQGVAVSGEQKITLKVVNKSLAEIIRDIERVSDYRFFYQNEQVRGIVNRSLDVKDASIVEVLDRLLYNTTLTYKIDNKHIVFYNRSEPDPQTGTATAEPDKTVSGRVVSGTGDPVAGVMVRIGETARGTTTDAEGRYSLSGIQPADVLHFRFIGMKSLDVTVGQQTSVDIVLQEDAIGLDDIVVIGYGTQRRSDMTGAVASVNLEATREAPNTTILQSLQGAVAGLNVGITREAGASPSISIRGQNTLDGGNANPLVVVDGVIQQDGPAALNYINPADIKSVDILKDASSTAIYGSRAANGVMIVTTKMGSSELSKPMFNFSTSYSIQAPSHRMELLDRNQQLLRVRDILWQQAYLAPDYVQPNPDFHIASGWGGIPEIIAGFENGTDYDWWNEATRIGSIKNNYLSMSGKTDRTSYFISSGITDQKGVVINDNFRRWTGRINMENKILDWLRVGIQSSVATTNSDGQTPYMSDIMRMSPFVVPYDAEGNLIRQPMAQNVPNPFEPLDETDYHRYLNLFGNVYANIDVPFVRGLSYKVNYSHNYTTERRFRTQPYANTYQGGATKYNSAGYTWTMDNILTYDRTFARDHSVTATLVAGREEREFESSTAEGAVYSNLDLGYNNLKVAQNQTISSSAWDETSLYYMTRLYYAYKGKYMGTFTVRRDGFSGFGDDNKFGIFPSGALAWVISKENFMRNQPLSIDFLKLRTSYGATGNRTAGRYDTLAEVSAGTSYIWGDDGAIAIGQHPTSMANPGLKWETTIGLNVGLDFSFLDSRIRGNVEYYNSNTHDILYSITIPKINGFTTIKQNIGKVHNHGLEVGLTTVNIRFRSFKWETQVNFSRNRNEVVSILGSSNDVNGDGREDDLVSSSLFIGRPLNSIYDYHIIGIYQLADTDLPAGYKPGQYRVLDIDDSGTITPDKDRQIIGYKDPSFRVSMGNTFTYKNFSLRVFLNSIQGGRDYYMAKNDPVSLGIGTAAARGNSTHFDYWTPRNPNARYAQLWEGTPNGISRYQQRDFVRLQDLSLVYNFSKDALRQLGVGGLKVYVSGKNLYTWTNWEGWDPETGQGFGNGMPVLRSWTFGLDLTF